MSIIRVNTVQDTDTNNILNESGGTITIGKNGDTVDIASGATLYADTLYVGGTIVNVLTFPTFTSISPSSIEPSVATDITITGTNFNAGVTVNAVATSGAIFATNSVTFNSATSLTANFTLTTNATYYIRIENSTGLSVRSATPVLTVSNAPTWVTGAGSLGTIAGGTTGTITTVSATSDSTITYTEVTSVLTNAALANCQLNSSTGVISSSGGFAGSNTSAVVYTFTLRATDVENQTADRVFTLTSSYGINEGGQFN